MKNLTEVVRASRGFRWTPSHIDYAFVKSIATSKIRQFSFELMANGDVIKLASGSGNVLFGLSAGDTFVINGTYGDLVKVAKVMRNHARYVYFKVEMKIEGETLFGKCY